MFDLRYRLFVGAALCGLVASIVAAPASASTAERGASFGLQRAQLSPPTTSRYLAGYRATDPKHVSGVIIKAVDVPEVNCSKPRFEGVALGGGSEPEVGRLEYFGGVFVTCVLGQAQYLMEAMIGDGLEQGTGIEAGDQAQIVISVQCDAYTTCNVFSSATSLDTDRSVSVQTTIDLTTDSAVFGAFPLFDGNSPRPAPVPDFSPARLQGCVFGNSLINNSAERLTRTRHGHVQIKATKVHVGSFTVKPPA